MLAQLDFLSYICIMKQEPVKYKSLSSYNIKNIGLTFVVANDKERPRDNNDLLGSLVNIDDEDYRVYGVESFLLPTIHVGDRIGILVEKPNLT